MFSDPDGAKILITLLVSDLDCVTKTLGKLTVHLKKRKDKRFYFIHDIWICFKSKPIHNSKK